MLFTTWNFERLGGRVRAMAATQKCPGYGRLEEVDNKHVLGHIQKVLISDFDL